MAFRAAVNAPLKSMVKKGLYRSNLTTSTSQKMKAYAPTSDQFLNPPPDFKAKYKYDTTLTDHTRSSATNRVRLAKGDFAPKCIALGLMAISTSLGVYTALHQLHSAPNVHLKKSRRETMPEVVEPEHVAAEAERFVKKSVFRKLAHLKDVYRQQVVPNPIAGDICTRPLRIETLKDVGVEPKP